MPTDRHDRLIVYTGGVQLYRSMTPDVDGMPRVSGSARGLGVRVPQDIVPDRAEFVRTAQRRNVGCARLSLESAAPPATASNRTWVHGA